MVLEEENNHQRGRKIEGSSSVVAKIISLSIVHKIVIMRRLIRKRTRKVRK